ncbi:Holliday junction branch migration protein RuvA [Candidatus Uhrbacteria bacterium]|nr:Holliday junction branch migration protein RuvA [Candidatus Uhrbacteria bacterium]
MLAFLRGTVLHCFGTSLVLEAHDVGYRVFVIAELLHRMSVGEHLSLWIHDHRSETASDLYGFATVGELELFERLISVSGVGPKTALNALSVASVDGIKNAIARGDGALLRSVAGIGSKTAERIVIELKGAFINDGAVGGSMEDRELIDALVGLGYTIRDAGDALRTLPQEEASTEERLKMALKNLSSLHR